LNPTYRHMKDATEAIRVEFNPATHNYGDFVKMFLKGIDPFNRCSSSRQYRYAIWYVNDAQKAEIERVVDEVCKKAGKTRAQFRVDVEPAGTFYKAEEYHQHYSAKSRGRYAAHDSSDGE